VERVEKRGKERSLDQIVWEEVGKRSRGKGREERERKKLGPNCWEAYCCHNLKISRALQVEPEILQIIIHSTIQCKEGTQLSTTCVLRDRMPTKYTVMIVLAE
jgi:hypothetical protein